MDVDVDPRQADHRGSEAAELPAARDVERQQHMLHRQPQLQQTLLRTDEQDVNDSGKTAVDAMEGVNERGTDYPPFEVVAPRSNRRSRAARAEGLDNDGPDRSRSPERGGSLP